MIFWGLAAQSNQFMNVEDLTVISTVKLQPLQSHLKPGCIAKAIYANLQLDKAILISVIKQATTNTIT